jgi:hypothetical protein
MKKVPFLSALAPGPFELQRYIIIAVRALEHDRIPLPPGHASAELEDLKAREDIMIKEPA